MPGSSPVPRWMAFLMLSAGMLTDFASAMMVRSRGFILGSPPPLRAATVSSLMMRVNTLPRLASAAPFLCLMVCHLEWLDIEQLPGDRENSEDCLVYQHVAEVATPFSAPPSALEGSRIGTDCQYYQSEA